MHVKNDVLHSTIIIKTAISIQFRLRKTTIIKVNVTKELSKAREIITFKWFGVGITWAI